MGPEISKKIGNLQVIEEELNTLGRQILAKQHRNNGTRGNLVNRPLLGAFQSIILNSY